jgi:hypothetical protein
MASSIWMPEPNHAVRTATSRLADVHPLTHRPMRVRPLPEHLLTGQMSVIQFSPDGIPASICRPADGS